MKEILAIIPARGGSKSIPRKNIKHILGKPMVYYSIEACSESKYITRFVVSTEDAEIKEICKAFGSEVIDRPMELAQDETKTAPVMLQVVDELEEQGYKPDYVVLIQPTSPFRTAEFVDNALDYMFSKIDSDKDCDSCFSGFDLGNTHAKWKEHHDGKLEGLYDYRNRPRRQEIECHYKLFSENGAFYAVRYDVFRKVKDFVGENPCVYLTNISFDVDEPSDFELAEKMLTEQNI
jgi:CMP-N,N'-diacetyllegionaminic acid synthase